MGTKIFAKVGLAVLLLAIPFIGDEISAVPDSSVRSDLSRIPDPDPERPGGEGKAAVLLPALIWNPQHYSSGAHLNQALLDAGYQAIHTPDLAPFIDSLSNYHLFVMARMDSLGQQYFTWADFQPYADAVTSFLQAGGSLYWEGASELVEICSSHAPSIYPYFQLTPSWALPGLIYYIQGVDNALFGPIFADIDSLVCEDIHSDFVMESACAYPYNVVLTSGAGWPLSLVCQNGNTHTMVTDFSWAWLNDSGLNTRVDLANDIMEWLFGPVGAEEAEPLPKDFALSHPYPNPFNAQTTIEYALPRAANVRLQVIDITGRVVATIASGIYPAGYYRDTWDAKDRASGVYFVRLQAEEYRETKKIVLLK